ncbi:MAG: histone family protein [archaeon]
MARQLPIAPVDRVIRRSGADRVSGEAADELAEILEEVGTEVSTQALRLARHAGRKTVTAEDIRLASRQL